MFGAYLPGHGEKRSRMISRNCRLLMIIFGEEKQEYIWREDMCKIWTY